MPTDSTVTLLLGSANRDPARWGTNAHVFDPDRDTTGHVAFGFGPHFCLGAALARNETTSAIEHVLPMLLDGDRGIEDEWVDSMQFRGRRHLRVLLDSNR